MIDIDEAYRHYLSGRKLIQLLKECPDLSVAIRVCINQRDYVWWLEDFYEKLDEIEIQESEMDISDVRASEILHYNWLTDFCEYLDRLESFCCSNVRGGSFSAVVYDDFYSDPKLWKKSDGKAKTREEIERMFGDHCEFVSKDDEEKERIKFDMFNKKQESEMKIVDMKNLSDRVEKLELNLKEIARRINPVDYCPSPPTFADLKKKVMFDVVKSVDWKAKYEESLKIIDSFYKTNVLFANDYSDLLKEHTALKAKYEEDEKQWGKMLLKYQEDALLARERGAEGWRDKYNKSVAKYEKLLEDISEVKTERDDWEKMYYGLRKKEGHPKDYSFKQQSHTKNLKLQNLTVTHANGEFRLVFWTGESVPIHGWEDYRTINIPENLFWVAIDRIKDIEKQ